MDRDRPTVPQISDRSARDLDIPAGKGHRERTSITDAAYHPDLPVGEPVVKMVRGGNHPVADVEPARCPPSRCPGTGVEYLLECLVQRGRPGGSTVDGSHDLNVRDGYSQCPRDGVGDKLNNPVGRLPGTAGGNRHHLAVRPGRGRRELTRADRHGERRDPTAFGLPVEPPQFGDGRHLRREQVCEHPARTDAG